MKLTNPNKLEWAIVYYPDFNNGVDQFLDIFYEQASKLNINLAANPYKFSTKSINTSDYEAVCFFFLYILEISLTFPL